MTRVIRTTYYLLEQTIILITAIIFTALTFAGCTSDSALTEGHGGGEPAILHLTFTIADGPTTRALSTSNENTVNDLTVLIFNSNHDLIGSKYSKYATSVTQMDVDTRQADGCTVCAIANTGNPSYFAGVNTLEQLNAMYTAKMSSAADLGNGSNCLMYGSKGPVSITGGTQIALTLAHVCSKMSLSIVPAAGITITGYQLCNTSMGSYLTDSHSAVTACPVGYGDFTAVTGLTSTSTVNATYYVYENLAGSNPTSNTEALRTSANAMANSTYLLVYATGSGWKSTYRIYLGGVTKSATPATDYTNYNIYRNYNYACTVNINGGSNGDARVIYTATSTRTGIYIGDAVIGNYLYDTGQSGTTYSSSHTVGIIYSNELTTEQYTNGCRHGKVLALKNANSGNNCNWANPATSINPSIWSTTLKTAYEDIASGYVGTIDKNMANTSTNYAYYYCRNYSDGTTKSFTNSGWYLPSAGDWWDVAANLGVFTDAQKTTIKSSQISNTGLGAYMIQGLDGTYFSSLNTKLSSAGGDQIVPQSGASYFWSASEYSSSIAVSVPFNSDYVGVNLGSKPGSSGYVRAVLAY